MILHRGGRGRAFAGALLLAGAAALAACASQGLGSGSVDRTRREIRERGLDPAAVVVPFETDDEMRRWARERVPRRGGRDEEQLQQLLLALLDRDGRELVYDRNHSATAKEVWREGVANCLSFTHLFVGLARDLGLPVYYLRVADSPHYEREGELVVASEHVVAAWGPPDRRMALDFSREPAGEYHKTMVISDLTAVALYYSNLGAGRIRAGRIDEALAVLDVATRIDPELADGWINRGVALRAAGRDGEAEAAFRRALEANPAMVSAYNNLASLLRQTGRDEEARRLHGPRRVRYDLGADPACADGNPASSRRPCAGCKRCSPGSRGAPASFRRRSRPSGRSGRPSIACWWRKMRAISRRSRSRSWIRRPICSSCCSTVVSGISR